MPRHPLVRFEVRRPPTWGVYAKLVRRVYGWTIRIALVVVLVAVIMELLVRARISFLLSMLMLMLPLAGLALLAGIGLGMVGWQIPLTLAGSAMIVHERESHTWEILLTTLIPHRDIMLAKLSVGLSRLQSFITVVTLLQALPLILTLGQVSRQGTNGTETLLLILMVTALFFVDRVQQFVLASLVGLTASLLADTWPIAVVGAVAMGTVVWLLHTVVAFLLGAALTNVQTLDVSQIIVVGLPALVGQARLPWLGMLLLVGMLIVQEGIVRTLFNWLEHHLAR